jgi:mannose-6-phosphate isomerase-like protein (cupin superfamily)
MDLAALSRGRDTVRSHSSKSRPVGARSVDVMNHDTTEPCDLGGGAALHLGLGARATPLPDFGWDAETLDAYGTRFAADGDEGRLVVMMESRESWPTWERHPAGEEVVVLVSGRMDLIQLFGDEERRVELRPGLAVVNPQNVWHTADVHEPGTALFITPGRGTENRPR